MGIGILLDKRLEIKEGDVLMELLHRGSIKEIALFYLIFRDKNTETLKFKPIVGKEEYDEEDFQEITSDNLKFIDEVVGNINDKNWDWDCIF